MDVVFVHLPRDPLRPENDWCLGFRYMLTALREEGYEARIVYPRVSAELHGDALLDDLAARVTESGAAVVGLTSYDVQLPYELAFVRRLRSHGCSAHVTIGGLSASALADQLLHRYRELDSVVVGEGEQTIVELTGWVHGRGRGSVPAGVRTRTGRGSLVGELRPPMANLADLALPALDDLDELGADTPAGSMAGRVPVITSRGCYGRCSFCSVQRFYRATPGPPWRECPAGAVAAAAQQLVHRTGSQQITFVDEDFMGPGRHGRRHALEVAAAMRTVRPRVEFNGACRATDVDPAIFAALRDAGLRGVTIGIESMWDQTLELFNKHATPAANEQALGVLDRLGIACEITFIFFQPLSTLAEIRANLAFVRRVAGSRHAYFSNGNPFTRFVPLGDTPLAARFGGGGIDCGGGDVDAARLLDPSAGLVAREVLAVPLDDLLRTAIALPGEGSTAVGELRERLRAHHAQVAMHRLPELAADLCDALERDASGKSTQAARALTAIRNTASAIRQVVSGLDHHLEEAGL
jgi:radical SAM superfamily enzyme YgiQ (UPF0313 family)